ncbi:pheromone-processing carboxypeptidase KEX1-like [Papaver somniferum]|uniref:pheromone-processing carboxypeptidase KEX1-like n=1 Tax=Papaver somniferum TaxID=3469 RepID=UPI000E7039C8|nr:pheromone-processing carboxypeptidase KEX1-like [Papaver somniferum]
MARTKQTARKENQIPNLVYAVNATKEHQRLSKKSNHPVKEMAPIRSTKNKKDKLALEEIQDKEEEEGFDNDEDEDGNGGASGDEEGDEDDGNDENGKERNDGSSGDDDDDDDDDKEEEIQEDAAQTQPQSQPQPKKKVLNASSARHIPPTRLHLTRLPGGKARGEPKDGGKVLFGYDSSWAHIINETILTISTLLFI